MDKGFSNLNSYKSPAEQQKHGDSETNQSVVLEKTSLYSKNKAVCQNKEQEETTYDEKHLFSNPKYSPIKIPKKIEGKKQSKNGYEQIKYIWRRGIYKYESRWHTKTPNAPNNEESWVVTRTKKGKGYGPNPIGKIIEVKVGNKWVSWTKWNEAINARKNNKATKQQIDMLNRGHFAKRGNNNE